MSTQPQMKTRELTKGEKEKIAAAERRRDAVIETLTKPLRRRITGGRTNDDCPFQNLAAHTLKAMVLDLALDAYNDPDNQGVTEQFVWSNMGDDPFEAFSRIRKETPTERLQRFAQSVRDFHVYLAGLGMNAKGFRLEAAEMMDAIAERSPRRLESPTLPFLIVDNEA